MSGRGTESKVLPWQMTVEAPGTYLSVRRAVSRRFGFEAFENDLVEAFCITYPLAPPQQGRGGGGFLRSVFPFLLVGVR